MSQKSEKKLRRKIRKVKEEILKGKEKIVADAVQEVKDKNLLYRIRFSFTFARAIIFTRKKQDVNS